MKENIILKSRWTLRLLSLIKIGFHQTSDLQPQDLSFYFAPNLNYYFSDHGSLRLCAGPTLSHYQNRNARAGNGKIPLSVLAAI